MARLNLQIKVFTYAGDASNDRIISGIGFAPDFVMVKGGANVACIRTKEMIGDKSVSMSSALATAADQIQGFTTDGFVLGTSALANAAATTYYGVAIRGNVAQSYFRTGKYYGTAADSRNYTAGGLNFTPDLVMLFGDTAQQKVWKSSSMAGDLAQYFGGVAGSSDRIQNLQSNGWQLGTSSEANGNTLLYFWLAAKVFAGAIAVGTYAGDGIDGKAISGVGFQPSAIIVKRDGASQGRFATSDQTANDSQFLGASASAAAGIKSITSDGFTVGTDNSVNNASSTYYWIAFKTGTFILPVTRLSA